MTAAAMVLFRMTHDAVSITGWGLLVVFVAAILTGK